MILVRINEKYGRKEAGIEREKTVRLIVEKTNEKRVKKKRVDEQ